MPIYRAEPRLSRGAAIADSIARIITAIQNAKSEREKAAQRKLAESEGR